MPVRLPPNYQPSPQPNRIYSGPVVPVAYDSNWQYFTNLTMDQVAWFQAQPEWAAYVATQPAVTFPQAPANRQPVVLPVGAL